MKNNKLRLLVVGLDGATFDVIQPLINSGELPNMAALINEGSHGNLESTIPPFSPPAWTSFMTGMNPGKHGVYSFVNYNPLSYTHLEAKSVTAASLAGHTFFDILSRAGYRLGVITVPITYPSWAINGYMVAGEPCPDTQIGLAYPEDFASELTDRYAFLSTFWDKPNPDIIDGLIDMDGRRTKLALKLIDEKDLDAMVVVLGATDRAQHNFWRYYDPAFGTKLNLPREADFDNVIPDIYRRADEAIGALLTRVGEDTTVIIISDHGGGPAATQSFHTNAWLGQEGYLSLKRGQDSVASGLRRVVMAARRGLGATIEERLRRLLPERFVSGGRALVRNVAQIDWLSTKAYRFPMYPPAEGIVINVEGRQPQGIVHPGDEYERIRDQIIGKAQQLKNPETGQPVIVRAYKREDLYHGPNAERAPDIVLMLADDYKGGTNVHLPLVTDVDYSSLSKVNGEHRLHGILIVRGPTVQQGEMIKDARLVDMAPTILYMLGLPVPREMDGLVIQDLFTSIYLDANPVVYTDEKAAGEIGSVESGLSPEEEEQVRRQLKRLGYL